MMDVSVGVMAYNEGKSIGRMLESLLKQRLMEVKIKDIFVVSSGSTDKTDDVVRDFCKRDMRIRLITEPERRGKARAINRFLGLAKTDIVILSSADIVLEKGAVERLCEPLLESGIGVTIARPVSEYGRDSFIGYTNNIVWEMWHSICSKNPKYGEFMAFRKIGRIEDTSVDEEFIGMLIARAGMRSLYVPEAVYYNTGPMTLKGFIRQRRRVFSGHLFLRRRSLHRASTMGISGVMKAFGAIQEKRSVWIVLAMGLEVLGRALGTYDYIRGKEAMIWEIAK